MSKSAEVIRRGIVVSVAGNIAPPLAAFASAPILAQALGVEGRGAAAAGAAPMLLAMCALTVGMPEAITYYVAKRGPDPAVLRRGLIYLAVAGVVGTVALVVLPMHLIPDQPVLITLMTISACALMPALLLSGLRGYAAGLGQWNVIALERLIGAGTRLVAVAGLAIANRLTVTSATVTIAATTFIGALAYLRLRHGRSVEWKASESARELRLMKFALGIWPGALVGTLLSRLDQTLLIGLSSVREIGLYVVAVSISEVTLVFNSAVRDVMFSNESEEQSSERLMKAARASTLMTVAASAVVAMGCIWGIPILFGPDFSDAVSVTMVLLVGVVLGTPGSVAGAGLSARGRPGLRSCSLGVALVINIGVLVALSPALGAFGAAIATVAGNAIAGYANVIWMKLLWDMPISGFMTIRKSDAVELCRSIKGVASRWKHTPA